MKGEIFQIEKSGSPSHGDPGLNADTQLLTRGASGWHPKVFIKTFGCQMNRSDSELMAALLAKDGYEVARDVQSADVVLLNTCSVRKHAEEKVWSELGRLGILKEEKGALILGVCGCMAQREGKEIVRRAPFVDVVCGPHNFGRIVELIDRAKRNGKAVVDVGESEEVFPSGEVTVPGGNGRINAWVSIMRGCNNFCAYCVVPYLRGREKSRPAEDIVKEIEGLVKTGIKEVTLLGQNVNSYRYRPQITEDRGQTAKHREQKTEHRSQTIDYRLQDINYRIQNTEDRERKTEAYRTQNTEHRSQTIDEGMPAVGFVDLLRMVNTVEGLERARFVTSHPRDMTEEILRVVSDSEKICEHLHLPLQAGSDRILKMMNRGYTQEYYRKLAQKAREIIPGVAISTDLIVGFPGETDADFEETLKMIRDVQFSGSFIYKYSPRPGTAAMNMEGEIPEEVKKARLRRVEVLQKQICLNRNQELIGKRVEVLIEGPSKKEAHKLSGRTRDNRIVIAEGKKELIGKLVSVKIIEVSAWTLYGELL
ncbi:MAG: MiaB/RimO family radical SAM methylthiotransferase [Nitrospirae bacterium]|nr:MiaB/RimO family radical SAM methylthiotransferase [Nitrospirota bacterium]